MPRFAAVLLVALWLVPFGLTGAVRSVALAADPPNHAPYLLSQPDLSSPKATLSALISNAELARRDFDTLGPTWSPRPPLLRMMATLDTSGISISDRVLGVAFAATRLVAVLVHVAADRLDDAPDAAAVKEHNITSWRVPGTPIVIARVATGPRAGQFLFTPETVATASQLYEAARLVPGQKNDLFAAIDAWSYSPGPLIPQSVIAGLPPALRVPVGGQAVWQWIGLGLLLLASGGVAGGIVRWGLRRDRRETRPLRRFGHPVAALGVVIISIGTLALAFFALKIWGEVMTTLMLVLRIVAFVALTWFVMAMIQRVASVIVAARGMRGTSIDSQLIRVVSTLLCIFVALTSGFLIADFVGIPLGPLLAGLGIGGFAIALAVRSTLENVIGGLTLFADRPVRVGEFCRVGTEAGTVEEIGLRTTKLRRLDDTLVTIPNSEMAQVRIENVTRRRRSLFNPRLGLRYETTPAQMREIEAGILAMLASHPKVLDEGARVRFSGFGDYTLNLDVFAHVDEARMPDFLKVQEELNFLILGIVEAAGASFAFPSQTSYLARDSLPAGLSVADPPAKPARAA